MLRPPCVADAYTVEAYLFESLRFLEIDRNEPIDVVLPRYAEPVASMKSDGLIVQEAGCGAESGSGSQVVSIPGLNEPENAVEDNDDGGGYPIIVTQPQSGSVECSGFEIPTELDLDGDDVKDVDDNCAFHPNASENGSGQTSADGMGPSCNPEPEWLTTSAPVATDNGNSAQISTSPATVGSADPICYLCSRGAPRLR